MATLSSIIYCLIVALILVLIISVNVVRSKNGDIQVLRGIAVRNREKVEEYIRHERADLARHYRAGKCDEEFFEFVVEHDNYILKILD